MTALRRLPIANLARLAAFLVVIWLVGAFFVSRIVSAEMNQIMLGLGAELMEYPGTPKKEVREVHLNGAQVFLRTQIVESPLGDVLDHYEAICESHDGQLREQFAEIKDTEPKQVRSITTRRFENQRAGFVSCLDLGEERTDWRSLVDRLERFAQTGDVAHVGYLRYVYAKPVLDAPSERSFVLTMWTDSTVNLFKLLPMEGKDAAGRDVEGIPRPPHTQRILSSWEQGQPYSVTIYASKTDTAEELATFYRDVLPKQGWELIERRPGESVQVDRTHLVAVAKEDRIVTVLSYDNEQGQGITTILTSDSL